MILNAYLACIILKTCSVLIKAKITTNGYMKATKEFFSVSSNSSSWVR